MHIYSVFAHPAAGCRPKYIMNGFISDSRKTNAGPAGKKIDADSSPVFPRTDGAPCGIRGGGAIVACVRTANRAKTSVGGSAMKFEEFQHHARLYILGALDEEEMVSFEEGRRRFGTAAEEYIQECRKLHAVFALSLDPHPPREDARERLMSMIRRSVRDPQGSAQKV